MPPVQPMLAKAVKGVPDPAKHDGLSYEPKWDGFRCLVFRDGDEVELASRNTKPLTRYFPEVVAACASSCPSAACSTARSSSPTEGRLEFEALQERIHPADVARHLLAEKTPAGVRRVRPARARRRVVRRPAVRRTAGRAGGGARRARRPVLPDPHHHRPGRGRGVVRPVRGRRARRGRGQAAGRAVPARTPAPCSRSSTSAPPTSWSPATACTRPPPRSSRCSAACCSACTTTGKLQHVGVARQLHRGAPGRAVRGAAAAGLRRSPTTRGATGRSS